MANTRRICKALSPLLGKAHLSKSTISRVVGRMKTSLERWRAPRVLIAAGHKGLAKAIEVWPDVLAQGCTHHKWNNLRDQCPFHARAELKWDWDAIVRADDGNLARPACTAFVRKWPRLRAGRG